MTRIDSRWFHLALVVGAMVLAFQAAGWLHARYEARREACFATPGCIKTLPTDEFRERHPELF